MERSDALIKFTAVVVLIAILIYGGYSVYNARSDALKTVPAAEMELHRSVATEGWLVRQETVLTAADGAAVTAKEGQKVAAGETLALTYSTTDDLRRAEEIRSLTLAIEQMESIAAGKSASASAGESVKSLAAAVADGELEDLDAVLLNVRTYVLGAEDMTAVEAEANLTAMRQRLNALSTSGGTRGAVTSPASGTFSSAVDGFEDITPAAVMDRLTPSALERLFSLARTPSAGAFGKLSSGIRWYYAAPVDLATASRLMGLRSVTVAFSRTYSRRLSMTVESVGPEEDGRCVVVLSASRYLQEVAGLREMTGEIIFEAETGLRIPREAIHLDEAGGAYVYVLKGVQAQPVAVTILGEEGDWYMVETGGGLRAGNQVITRAPELYEGAVVVQ